MAAEAEIERFLVRYIADTTDAKRGAQEMVSLTQQTTQEVQGLGEGVAGGMDQAGESIKTASFRIRDLRRGLGLLSATAIIPPEAGAGVFKLVIGLSLASKAASIASASLGTFKAALVGTGVGAIVVILGEVASWLASVSSGATKAREAANQAFGSMASGAKTLKQAMSEIKVNVLSESLQKVSDILNPSVFGGSLSMLEKIAVGWKKAFGVDVVAGQLEKGVAQMEAAQAALQQLAQRQDLMARIRVIAQERLTQASSDTADAMEDEADRSMMAEGAAKRYAEAQQLARQASISLAQALDLLAASHARQAEAAARIDISRLTKQIDEMQEAADRAGLRGIDAQIMQMAQAFARANEDLAANSAQWDELGRQLGRVRGIMLGKELKEMTAGLADQIATFGLSSDRAALYRLRLQGLTDAEAGLVEQLIRQKEIMEAMRQPLEQVQAVRARSQQARFLDTQFRVRNEFNAALAGRGGGALPINAAMQALAQATRAGDAQQINILGQIRQLLDARLPQPGQQQPAIEVQPAGL